MPRSVAAELVAEEPVAEELEAEIVAEELEAEEADAVVELLEVEAAVDPQDGDGGPGQDPDAGERRPSGL